MMREFKFRAWDKVDKKVRKVMSLDFYNTRQSEVTLASDGDIYLRYFEQTELMQSTGLFDKSGKEIYEGDIVRWKDLESFDDFPIDEVLKVEYSDEFMKWITCNKNDLQDDLYDFTDNRDLEVIGNIYENPELVEVE